MNKKKILFTLLVVVMCIVSGKMGLFASENNSESLDVSGKKMEMIFNQVKESIPMEDIKSNKHLFYISTPLCSIGIL